MLSFAIECLILSFIIHMADIDLRVLAHALLNLTGLSTAELARQSDLHRPNLVGWLGGKENVMAIHNQLKACETLGWRNGGLRRDLIHRWWVGEKITDLKTLLRRESTTANAVLFVCPTTRGVSGKEVVLLSVMSDGPPLVILLRRPLAVASPRTLSATLLGIDDEPDQPHIISDREWTRCWSDEADLASPDEYLDKFARKLLVDCKHAASDHLLGRRFAADRAEQDLTRVKHIAATPEENAAWLALLEKAKAGGLSFAEITKRFTQALLQN